MSRKQQGGDGDPCPQTIDLPPDEQHGRMYTYPASQMQYCPHAGHRGENRYRWDGVTPWAEPDP